MRELINFNSLNGVDLELIKEIGQKKQGKRSYMFGLFKCPTCGNEVEKIKKDGLKAKSCSRICYSSERTRIRRGGYNDFVIINSYRYRYAPSHPKAIGTKKLYVAEHRLIVESKLGRFLTDEEIVHHINENTLDNRVENLQVMSASEHSLHHSKDRSRGKDGRFTV